MATSLVVTRPSFLFGVITRFASDIESGLRRAPGLEVTRQAVLDLWQPMALVHDVISLD
ncbi:hypothetical protein GCM10017711_21820 [Paeniglutamicibacter sulfureus]